MTKIIDNIFLFSLTFLIAYGWARYLSGSATLAVVYAALFGALVWLTLFLLRRLHEQKSVMGRDALMTALSFLGADKCTKNFAATLPDEIKIGVKTPFVLTEKDGKKTLYFINIKFQDTSEEDVARAYREATLLGVENVTVISRNAQRKARLVAASTGLNFRFPSRGEIRSYLIKHNAVPEKRKVVIKRVRVKPDFSDLVEIILDPRRIKYYLFVGITLFALSFFTPLKLYYLIISTVPLALAVGALVKRAIDAKSIQ